MYITYELGLLELRDAVLLSYSQAGEEDHLASQRLRSSAHPKAMTTGRRPCDPTASPSSKLAGELCYLCSHSSSSEEKVDSEEVDVDAAGAEHQLWRHNHHQLPSPTFPQVSRPPSCW